MQTPAVNLSSFNCMLLLPESTCFSPDRSIRRNSLSSTKLLSPHSSGEEERPEGKLAMCNREIVRRGALILFCDYVVRFIMQPVPFLFPNPRIPLFHNSFNLFTSFILFRSQCQNLHDSEHLTWLTVNHVSDLISLSHEPPVQDLISAVHRNSAASGLFIQAIQSRCDNLCTVCTHTFDLDFILCLLFHVMHV